MIKGKGKILIIADDQRFTSVIQELVKKNSGSELVMDTCLLPQGKNAVKETMPDVIILDGDRHSKEKTAEYIRNLMPKYSRPLIVCTVKHNSNYGFMSAGASDVVMKQEEAPEKGICCKRCPYPPSRKQAWKDSCHRRLHRKHTGAAGDT